MLIFGQTTLNTTQDEGEFYCPQCDSESTYKKKIAREYLTFYFIPVIPAGVVGEFIQCDQCRGQFDASVLDYDPEEERRLSYEATRRLLVLTMLTTGRIESGNIEALKGVLFQHFEQEVTEEEIFADVQQAEEIDAQLVPFAVGLTHQFPQPMCVLMLKCMSEVLGGDGDLTTEDKQILEETSVAMGFAPGQVRALWEPPPPDAAAEPI